VTIGDERWVGPDGVLELFRRASAQFADADFLPARHHLSSIYAEPMPDGSAKTYACFQFIGLRGLDHRGTYRDVAVPVQNGTDDGWRFAQAGRESQSTSPNRQAPQADSLPASHRMPGHAVRLCSTRLSVTVTATTWRINDSCSI
jgi:hypothetical protein